MMCLKSLCFSRVQSSEHLWINVLDAEILSKESQCCSSQSLSDVFFSLSPLSTGPRSSKGEGALPWLKQLVAAVHSFRRLQPCIPSRCQHFPATLSVMFALVFTISTPGFPICLFQKTLCPRWKMS